MSVTTYDLGTVLMVPKGDWSASVSYERLNLVRHNGTAWLCTVAAGQTSLGHEPSASSPDWEILVQDQSSVTSVNGQRGDVTIDESDIVHKAGTETITGDKTFSGMVTAVTPSADDESTKVATTEWVKNTTLTNAVGSGANLFDVKWSDHRLNDMSWLRSDTFSWHNGEVYSAAYQELLDEYTNRSDNTVYKAFAKANYTAVGSKIKEWRGIVSGFSSASQNYITHSVAQPTSSMEYVVKIYVAQWTNAYIIGSGVSVNDGPILAMSNYTTGALNLYLSTNGSSWNIANNASTGMTAPLNKWVWYKFAWNGSTFTISESYNGKDYIQKYSIACAAAPKFSNSVANIGGTSVSNQTANWYGLDGGKVDLQECYFKADGNIVWSGAEYIEYVITDKKYRIALPSQAEKIKQSYDDYGIAWYYILDSTNTRFKLPRTKYGFVGYRGNLGNLIEAGAPNITGALYYVITYAPSNTSGTGALKASHRVDTVTLQSFSSGANHSCSYIGVDASLSNAQYGNSDTIQPPATEMYLYHYVGDFNRQAVLANIGVTSENIDSTTFLNTPVGTIIWSMANSVPAGYLVCNGQAVGRLAYPELFSAIGTTYGAGDGDSTFNLPNLIGKFVEGNATAGIEHEAGLPNIEGTMPEVMRYTANDGTGAIRRTRNGAIGDATSQGFYKDALVFNASLSNSIYGNSNTVQPPSLTAMPCIKAFDAVVNEGTVDVGELIDDVNTVINNGNTIINNSGKVTQVGTRTSTGDWSITGLTVGKPLYILGDIEQPANASTGVAAGLYVKSGGSGGYSYPGYTRFWFGGGDAASTNVLVTIPTDTTVIIGIFRSDNSAFTFKAYQ